MLHGRELITRLVQNFCLANYHLSKFSEGNTALHEIAQRRPDLLPDVLSARLNLDHFRWILNIKNSKDETVLDTIIQHEHNKVLKFFLRFADETLVNLFSEINGGNTTLHTIISQKPKLVLDLLKKFPSEQLTNFLKMQDNKKDTVLHVIAKSNTGLFLDLLVKDLEDKQVRGVSHYRLISLLSIKNDEGRTPLYYAVSYHESRDATSKKCSMKNYNNPLDFVLKVIKKVDLKSCTNLKPFIDLLNIKCDGDLTLVHMILQEPYEDKWKEVIEQIPNYVLKQYLDTCDDSKNILSDELKIAALNQRLGEEVLKISIPKMEEYKSQLNPLQIQSLDCQSLMSKSQRGL